MPLSAGSCLGPYEILAPLGAGGMGEVYRARDTKLKRDVALKVLPEALASDPERMARFQREAEVLASLNHPNIAAIYGVEDHALVMELVEGESPKGPMAFDDAWRIASQIASALEYAHERGIVHRDLKPANIKITTDGVVKLLDFGLAKAFTNPKEPLANAENSPTLTIGSTEVGMILGTAAYMSPEQAKGKAVDKRADIWAFGVVLYELLTGERLFKGEDISETLAQVLTKQPDWDRVPGKARRLLQDCLEKDPKRRLRDIGDAERLIEEQPQAKGRAPTWLPWAVIGVLAVALGITFFALRREPPQRTVLRSTIALPQNTTGLHSFAISPDGRLFVMAAEVNGKRQLWLRPLDALEARLLPDTDDAAYPFWSPDSGYIGFFAHGALKKIAARGGPAQSLCAVPNGMGGSWSRENVMLFSPSALVGAALQRISAAGGAPADVIRNKGMTGFPTFLSDGHHFLYQQSVARDQKGIYLASLDGKENLRLLPDVSPVVFAAGRILFVRENALWAQRLDVAKGQLLGEASPVAEGVSFTNATGYMPVTASDTAVLVYTSGGSWGAGQKAWYDRARQAARGH